MLIEFTGMVGSGKSTVAAELKRLLQADGFTALSPAEALERCLGRSWLGRAIVRWAPAIWRERLQGDVLRMVASWHRLAFAISRPQLVWHVLQSQLYRKIPWWHRRIIIDRFFEVAGQYRYFCDHLQDGEVIVLEEGFVHRATNLYAWESQAVDPELVRRYLSLLPQLDLVVFVRAPLDICLERADVRGLPQRLRDKERVAVDRFMINANTISCVIFEFLTKHRRELIEVDNSGDRQECLTNFRHRLEDKRIIGTWVDSAWKVPSAQRPEIGN